MSSDPCDYDCLAKAIMFLLSYSKVQAKHSRDDNKNMLQALWPTRIPGNIGIKLDIPSRMIRVLFFNEGDSQEAD